MLSKFENVAWIIFWIALGGVGVWGWQAATAKPFEKPPSAGIAQRRQAVATTLAAGPQTTSWSTPHGDVIELSVPSATVGGRLLELRRCIVWRDHITSSSSMSCDPPEIELATPEGPEYSQ